MRQKGYVLQTEKVKTIEDVVELISYFFGNVQMLVEDNSIPNIETSPIGKFFEKVTDEEIEEIPGEQ
jgi:hypothetical protein